MSLFKVPTSNLRLRSVLSFFFLLIAASLSSGVAAAAAATTNVAEGELPNGLRMLVKSDHRAPVVVVMVWYRVGSVDETSGSTGGARARAHDVQGHQSGAGGRVLSSHRPSGRSRE